MKACGNCRFWVHYDEEDGLCRRYAPGPVRMKEEYEYRPAFPIMGAAELCGEHEPKEAADEG